MPTGKRSQASSADTYEAFHTDESFKAAAQRLGISPNTLRRWWVEKFGQDAFDARGKKLQASRAASFNQGQVGKTKKLKVVQEPCAICGAMVEVNSVQRARLTQVLCVSCEGVQRGVDRHCPVCGFGCVGARGLAGHMAAAALVEKRQRLLDVLPV
jgi:transposase-like protein